MARQLGACRESGPANKAAEELAGYEGQFAAIRTDMTALRGEVIMHRWMLGTHTAISIAIALKLFVH